MATATYARRVETSGSAAGKYSLLNDSGDDSVKEKVIPFDGGAEQAGNDYSAQVWVPNLAESHISPLEPKIWLRFGFDGGTARAGAEHPRHHRRDANSRAWGSPRANHKLTVQKQCSV